MDYTKKLMVEPDAKVRLAKFDPAFHGRHADAEAAERELDEVKGKIGTLQRKMYGDNRHSLLIVLQGLDAAGKDGVCWHVVSAMDPQGCKVQGFKAPTAEEAAHDFLWRVHPHAPGKGEVAVFNRSHYEDVLVTRVHKLVPKKVWQRRYDLINDWERLLVEENGTIILKRSSCAASPSGSTTRTGSGRSAMPTTRSAPSSTTTWRPSTRRWSGPRPRMRRGSRSPVTTNGSATWRWPGSSWARWRG